MMIRTRRPSPARAPLCNQRKPGPCGETWGDRQARLAQDAEALRAYFLRAAEPDPIVRYIDWGMEPEDAGIETESIH